MKIICSFIASIVILSSTYVESYSFNHLNSNDSAVLPLSKEILAVIKERDYDKLSVYFHPVMGVRFSPYSHIDTTADIVMTKEKFLKFADSKERLKWGEYDGSGEAIKFNVREYFKRFVYDVDFLNSEHTNLNSIMGGGNTLENILVVYEGFPFTESYFSGFDEKFSGMDWRSLKLVYKKYEDKYYLVGIIHSEWTI